MVLSVSWSEMRVQREGARELMGGARRGAFFGGSTSLGRCGPWAGPLLCGLVVMLGAGCRAAPPREAAEEETPPPAVARAWGEAVGGIQIALETEDTRWSLTRAPVVRVEIRNHGDAIVGESGVARLELSDGDGHRYWSAIQLSNTRDLPFGKRTVLSLPVGEAKHLFISPADLAWTSVEMPRWPTLPLAEAVAPGSYELSFVFDGREEGEEGLVVRSPVVAIALVPAQ